MRSRIPPASTALFFGLVGALQADPLLMENSCSKCHNDDKLKGDFSLNHLGEFPTDDNIFLWEDSLDFVTIGEMPPIDESELTDPDRELLVRFLTDQVRSFHESATAETPIERVKPRRLNNRELENSVRDVLMIEDVGTHQPTDNLLGDILDDGFDTNGDALGMSQFHLEQYIEALRKIVGATILTGKKPASKFVEVKSQDLHMTSLSQTQRKERVGRTPNSIDFHDMRLRAYFGNFKSAPATGNYRLKIRATGVDRGFYDSKKTGIYDGDPIRLRVHLGNRVRDFDLPDEEVEEIVLEEWIAEGTQIFLSYPTDGLRLRSNGNFKFQYAIAGEYIREYEPELYHKVVTEIVPHARARSDLPNHWVHWTEFWRGPRPRLFGAEVEGPFYDSWPAKRQVALLGENPKVENAAELLRPIAERAWRREVSLGELDGIAELVKSSADSLGEIEAFKEGIVAIMVSPSFLLVNAEDTDPADRFANRLSYFLRSTTPSVRIQTKTRAGGYHSFGAVRKEVARQFSGEQTDEFKKEFPQAWLELGRINFMSPDPEYYPIYDKKRLNEDMIAEALQFFAHVVENNLPVTEFLSADYSFVNADLARVYGVKGVPEDSKLRKTMFQDGRRGGLLGMGAFLTLTADSLNTSPIHRAVYVMENLMGIHPSPPPADVKISEPDVRQAKTIKEILALHTESETCASCHKSIDPYGYAFENFDPVGAWREFYTMQIAKKPTRKAMIAFEAEDLRLVAAGLAPQSRPWENEPIPVDATNVFRNGSEYGDIIEFRELMNSDVNRDRFVRCFISKLLVYATGEEPKNYWEVEKILQMSALHDYRILETIAAVIDSPLFREGYAADVFAAPELASITKRTE